MRPPGAKLTTVQFRLLQRIPDDGLTQTTLRQGRGSEYVVQIECLHVLLQLGLVVETRGDGGESRFDITDAGRRLVEADGAG
jgi:predicted transcriptional regulator